MAAIDDAYRRFSRIWGDSQPIRRPEELAAALAAASLEPEDVGEDWIRSLDPRWVYGDSEAPFADERSNRAYRRLMEQT